MSLLVTWQISISSQMIGLEALIALEILLMVANLQTLGTPISYTSIPGTVAPAVGVMLIPTLGFVMDRWGQSRRSKAKILASTSCVAFLGGMCIFFANGLDLLLNPSNTSIPLNLTARAAVPFTSTSVSYFAQSLAPLNTNTSNITTYLTIGATTLQLDAPGSVFSVNDVTDDDDSDDAIPWTAYLAMAGYAMIDHGYDSSSCFLKTFIFECAPAEFHASLVLKALLCASVGGVLVALLGSFNVGQMFTTDTHLDPNAALCCFLSVLGAFILIAGYTISMSTGFFWDPPVAAYKQIDNAETQHKENTDLGKSNEKRLQPPPANENTKLLSVPNTTGDGAEVISPIYSRMTSSCCFQSNSMREPATHKDTKTEIEEEESPDENGPSAESGLRRFFRKYKKHILVNMMAFCMLSAVYSYEMYYVNFLGEAIFGGDPSAPTTSIEYLAYLNGVSVGSRGMLIFYVTFAIFNILHEKSLALLGWKLEALIVSLFYSGLTLATALSLNLWVNYVATAWLGVCRAVFLTTPYILVNQFSAQQNGGKSSGTAIAFVAAMLPAGFLICSAIMGPVIGATGNPVASVYYASALAFLGFIFVLLL